MHIADYFKFWSPAYKTEWLNAGKLFKETCVPKKIGIVFATTLAGIVTLGVGALPLFRWLNHSLGKTAARVSKTGEKILSDPQEETELRIIEKCLHSAGLPEDVAKLKKKGISFDKEGQLLIPKKYSYRTSKEKDTFHFITISEKEKDLVTITVPETSQSRCTIAWYV